MAAKNLYRDMEERLIANSVLNHATGCWEWIGRRTGYMNYYGKINVWCSIAKRAVTKRVHRVSYEVFIGPIPEGMELDHLCRNPICIHPNHLEPVTGEENIARRDAAAA